MNDNTLIEKIDSTILAQNSYLADNKSLLMAIHQFFVIFPETIVSGDEYLYRLSEGELIQICITTLPSPESVSIISDMSIGRQIDAINHIKKGLSEILLGDK